MPAQFVMENLGVIIVLAIVVALVMNFILPIIPYFSRRSRTYIEKATDAHEAVYRKRKKAARLNLKGTRVKYLKLGGDDYHYPVDMGRVVGIIPGNPVSEIFWKNHWLGKTRWGLIPTALTTGWLGRVLFVNATGLVPVGNFYRPIWPADSPLWKYEPLIFDHEAYIMSGEKAVELEECRVHSISDSVQMSTQDRRIIERRETPPQRPADEYEGGREADAND